MTRKTFVLLAFSIVMLFMASASMAALVPRPGSGDPRIFIVDYDPSEVVELRTTLGYQTFVEFAEDERIENVAIGDATGWQVTPNRKANLLFVKPMSDVAPTNMTVVTNLRRYAFELSAQTRAAAGRNIVYTLRFLYPEKALASIARTPAPASAPPTAPQVVNSAYSYNGSSKILPARIFDDGRSTYFQFREGEEYPAIFSIDASRNEAVINSHSRGGYVVVDIVGPGYVLRRGNEVAQIFNDGFREAQPGPQSPKFKPKTCWLFVCR